jgi:hypothetical protein
MMDTLAAVARRRAVLTTVADLIVTAASGRTLRVAVECAHAYETGFVDQLAQALHARGRPCRCLPGDPDPAADDRSTPAGGPIVSVITSGSPAADDTELCRINIEVRKPTPVGAPPDSLPPDSLPPDSLSPDSAPPGTEGRHTPDLIVDDLGPDGLTIRHIQATLTSSSDRLPGGA